MDNYLHAAEELANFLDGKFKFFKFRFGMNGVLGLVPVIGDFLASFLSLYLVWIGIRMHFPATAISQMLANIMTNFIIGLVPVIGDFADFFNHANLKNLKILKQYAKGDVIEGEMVE